MKTVLLHVRDQAEELEVRKYLAFKPETTKVVYRVKNEEIADANGVVRMTTTANPEADAAVRAASRNGDAIYSTGVYMDNADAIGDLQYINLWALKNKSKSKNGTQHCFLSNVKDSEALGRLKENKDFLAAFGLGAAAADEPAF